MKKIYTVITLFMPFLFQAAVAQTNLSVGESQPVVLHHVIKGSNSVLANDTLVPPSFGMPLQCDTAPKLYSWSSPATGHVWGNNSYGETECAQKYYASGSVTEVLVWIGSVKGAGGGSTSANIYSIDGTTKGPSSIIGTSPVVMTSNIVTNAFTSYLFSSPVTVNTEFAITLVFPTSTGDSVAVVSTPIGCSTTDSLCWMNFPTIGWKSIVATTTSHVNADLWMFPVGTGLAGVNEYSANGLSLLGAYPNPAKDFTSLQYRIDKPGTVAVTVFDLTGRVILNSSETLTAGTHDIKISLKDLSAGNYYYTVKTEGSQLTSKFAVTK